MQVVNSWLCSTHVSEASDDVESFGKSPLFFLPGFLLEPLLAVAPDFKETLAKAKASLENKYNKAQV
jgi:hypothetical protein